MTALAAVLDHDPGAGEPGDRGAYVAGCRCALCTAAEAAYRAQYRREPPARVAIGQVQKRVEELIEAGYSQEQIARRARLSQSTLSRIVSGRVKRCSVETRRAILGMALDPSTNDISVIPDEEIPPPAGDPIAGLLAELRGLDLSWKDDAQCARLAMRVQRRQDWFFSLRGDKIDRALAICGSCPVWRDCLSFALATFEAEGVWGRTAGSHRRKIHHDAITVDELADAGMADDPDLRVDDAIARVLAARETAA